MTTDFAQLYLQLGIRNDCTLQEFKQACRRRIRQQHPDRTEDRISPEATQAALAELLGLYAKALRFHRRHGRLPGGVAPAAPPSATSLALHATAPSYIPPTTGSPPPAIGTSPTPRFAALRNPVLILAATIATFAAFNAWNESGDTVEGAEQLQRPCAVTRSFASTGTCRRHANREEPAPRTDRGRVDAATCGAAGHPLPRTNQIGSMASRGSLHDERCRLVQLSLRLSRPDDFTLVLA